MIVSFFSIRRQPLLLPTTTHTRTHAHVTYPHSWPPAREFLLPCPIHPDEGEWAEAMVGRTWVVVAVGMDGILGVRWSLSLWVSSFCIILYLCRKYRTEHTMMWRRAGQGRFSCVETTAILTAAAAYLSTISFRRKDIKKDDEGRRREETNEEDGDRCQKREHALPEAEIDE